METVKLKTVLHVNNSSLQLNDFTQVYIGNALRAIAKSLGMDSDNVTVHIGTEGLQIYLADEEIALRKDFARQLIENTIKGMLSPLKGVFWTENITITTSSRVSAQARKEGRGPSSVVHKSPHNERG
jgi:hypothetical protein